jgi:hypothetical protein
MQFIERNVTFIEMEENLVIKFASLFHQRSDINEKPKDLNP